MPIALRSDIVIHKPNGLLVALVEVKNRETMDPQVASQLRRNLIVHGFLPDVPYFMLLSQDKAFVWTNRHPQELMVLPDAEISMKDVFDEYLPKDIEGRLRGEELAIAVYSWLSDLTLNGRTPQGDEGALAKTGFIDAIRGAVLSREVA